MVRHGKGWRNEPLRHSLARKGVKTGRKSSSKMSYNEKLLARMSEDKKERMKKNEEYRKRPLLKLKKGDNVMFIGRRWFDKINGNTYHTTEVYVNGKFVAKSEIGYGYGEQYVQSGIELLEDNGFIRKPENDVNHLYTMALKYDYGINVNTSVSDVTRKKDL